MSTPHISALYTYPVKSCAGIRHESAELIKTGLRFDRQWMVISADNTFLTQREVPALALVKTAISNEQLTLSAPGLPAISLPIEETGGEKRDVIVWHDTCLAIDAGNDTAEWFSEHLNMKVRLVRKSDSFERLTSTDYTSDPALLSFADGYPLLFIAERSLDDLNRRLAERGKARMSMDRFRPNIVFGGCEPYAEDTWQQIKIADIRFDIVKPCARCAITTVDQAQGTIPDVKEPLATLATYRRGKNGVIFGQNALHRDCGRLQVGDVVEIVR